MKNQVHKLLPYSARIELRRFGRGFLNMLERQKPSHKYYDGKEKLNHCLAAHRSTLIRKVPGHHLKLQHNKVRNLELGCSKMNNLLLEPGDIFSFCSIIGRTTYRRGYIDGLEMHQGELRGAPGGGLCQLANLIFWMALHLDLKILERHHHELDLFPDDNRIVPFGMGASVLYNYRDLRFQNTLKIPVVLLVSVNPPFLEGAFYSFSPLSFKVEIFQKDQNFFRDAQGIIWRQNRVFKRILNLKGEILQEKESAFNLGQVCYEVKEELISSQCAQSTQKLQTAHIVSSF